MEIEGNACSICLLSQVGLCSLNEMDSNGVNLLKKLTMCVPEVQWSPNELICKQCAQQVDAIVAFRKQCIDSHTLQTKQQADIKSDTRKQERSVRLPFTCDLCSAQFNKSKKLVAHALAAHDTQMKPFRCEICGSRFKKSSNLNQHRKYHEGNRDNVCLFCGKGFVTKGDLSTHEKKHLNAREYGCASCAKRFNTRKDLRSHELIVHTDPETWSFCCGICSKKFPIKSNYDQHVRRHAGDRRFACHLCEKKFVDKVVLKRHVVSHSNVRAFKCEHCEKEYKQLNRLKVHLKLAHGVGDVKLPERMRKYFCHVCPKGFYAKNRLLRHLCTHSGEKPYSCEVCGKHFVAKYYVKQHLKNAHNVSNDDHL